MAVRDTADNNKTMAAAGVRNPHLTGEPGVSRAATRVSIDGSAFREFERRSALPLFAPVLECGEAMRRRVRVVFKSKSMARRPRLTCRLKMRHFYDDFIFAARYHSLSARYRRGAEFLSMPKILVVDDHGEFAQLSAQLLLVEGYDARWATDPDQAVALARDFTPAVLFVDLHLQDAGQDGVDLARKLSALFPGLKIFLMTGSPLELVADRITGVANIEIVEKPVDVVQLMKKWLGG